MNALTVEEPPPLPVGPGALVGGRYRIVRVIAHGGMGVICEGVHIELEQPVAIKFIRPDLARDPELVGRFIEEARAAAALRSPHVVRVMDVGQLPAGIPYMVMEHLEGIDLYTALERDGRIEPTRAVDYMIEVCEALAEAHAAGIIHRDIKPENLFVCVGAAQRPVVKIVDFGIAKRLRARRRKAVTRIGDVVGSPWYMSPEQLSAPQTVDSRTDIWSVGVALYELVTGQRPFQGATPAAVCANVLRASPRPPSEQVPELAPGLESVILRCLSKDPSDRFSDIDELLEALEPFGSRPNSSRPPPPRLEPFDRAEELFRLDTLVAPISESGRTPPPVAASVIGRTAGPPRSHRGWRRPAAIAFVAMSAMILLGFSDVTETRNVRLLTDGWLTPASLGASPEMALPPGRPGISLMPRGVFGAAAGATVQAERELELIELTELLTPTPSREAVRRKKRRAYRDYLRSQGLTPIRDALEDLGKDADGNESPSTDEGHDSAASDEPVAEQLGLPASDDEGQPPAAEPTDAPE